jgi:hypothetical protein
VASRCGFGVSQPSNWPITTAWKMINVMPKKQPTAPLATIMNSVATRMQAEFDASSVMAHAGGKGAARERIIHSVIEPYLPRNLRVFGSTEVISASGERSGQCDIVIVDHRVPPLLDLENHRVVPCEGVYVVIEVKTTLTKPELNKACRTIASVKTLSKIAKTAKDPEHYVDTVGMVFSFAGPKLQTIGANLAGLASEYGGDKLPDSVWVLGKGFFDIDRQGGQSTLRGLEKMENEIILALMTRLNAHYNNATMPLLNLDHYAGDELVGRLVGQWPLSR